MKMRAWRCNGNGGGFYLSRLRVPFLESRCPAAVGLSTAIQLTKLSAVLGSKEFSDGQGPAFVLETYFASTHTLSAEPNSTPATSVLRFTGCNPDFLPGLAL